MSVENIKGRRGNRQKVRKEYKEERGIDKGGIQEKVLREWG